MMVIFWGSKCSKGCILQRAERVLQMINLTNLIKKSFDAAGFNIAFKRIICYFILYIPGLEVYYFKKMFTWAVNNNSESEKTNILLSIRFDQFWPFFKYLMLKIPFDLKDYVNTKKNYWCIYFILVLKRSASNRLASWLVL